MEPGTMVALVLAVLVGVTVGALGGGGAVLTLPIFVYIAGIPVPQAIPMSIV